MPLPRRAATLAAVGSAALALGVMAPTTALAAPPLPPGTTYTVTMGATGPDDIVSDSPASGYIDKDGTFYAQASTSGYGATDAREWGFWSGTDFDTATADTTIDNAVNPANSQDANNNTTWRCNNSPTGLEATDAPAGSSYTQANYCDLIGTWVDPDTGNWIGLVHDEFTPSPFGDGMHYDSIDYAVSTNQGMTWTIEGHAITSPYATVRGDTTTFPNQTYYFGDGDPRLFVDTASGYFYVYYSSMVVDKPGGAGSDIRDEHVARAPISGKMATGSWQKWYNGSWSQPGVGGKESDLEPVTTTYPNGYVPAADDYNPANTGYGLQQITAGTLPAQSPLLYMSVTYDAYLGLYIAEANPENTSSSPTNPEPYFATDNLATQQWYEIGNTGSVDYGDYWYHWFVDSVNDTNQAIVGKTFREYCEYNCPSGSAEWRNITIGSTTPAAPIDLTKTYTIGSGAGQTLAQVSGSSATTSVATPTGSLLQSWAFAANGDGSYRIINASTGQLLGVDSTTTTSRAWGTAPTVTALGSSGPTVGQQWFLIPDDEQTGTFRIVNRYSGLVISLSSTASRLVDTTPTRDWTNTTGNSVGGTRTAAEQTLTLTASGTASESVLAINPGNQAGAVGTAASVQISATDSQNKALTYTATGLPAGLSINSSTGLISGTPTTTATSTVTVTASSGTASSTTSFTWLVSPIANGTYTVAASGMALDDPGSSTTTTQLTTATPTGTSDQKWVFTEQSDGSYQIVNASSGYCVDLYYSSLTAGAAIQQFGCTGNSNQHWIVTPLSGGGYSISSSVSGLLITTASTTSGALVTQQANTNSALQKWTIS